MILKNVESISKSIFNRLFINYQKTYIKTEIINAEINNKYIKVVNQYFNGFKMEI